MKRTAVLAVRLLFLLSLSLVFLPACGGNAAGGSAPGIAWNPTSTAGGGGGTAGPAGVL